VPTVPKEKRILLVRHEESRKTLTGAFGDIECDMITERGRSRSDRIAKSITSFAKEIGEPFELFYAKSARAMQTAERIAKMSGWKKTPLEIRSINLGRIEGLSAQDVEKKFPEFSRTLGLYRAGLFNSYDLPFPHNAESPMDFERRTFSTFKRAVKNATQRNLIFVLHRSPMTAMLISIARASGHYPEKFYGIVPMQPGDTFLVTATNTSFGIHAANIPPSKLLSSLRVF